MIIVGGGQAGLAVSRVLQSQDIDHVVLEADVSVGASWARRWDSLTLFTPAEHSSLPGFTFPAERGSYPTKDDVAAYLEAYVDRFRLPVRLGQRVTRLHRSGDTFVGTTASGAWHGRAVIIASGAFGAPWVPPLAAELRGIRQLHAAAYRGPEDVNVGSVLVVGAGNTGAQLALELAHAGHGVTLAGGRGSGSLPQRLLGKDIFWWLGRTGLLRAPAESTVGRRLRENEPVIGTTPRILRAAGVKRRPRVVAAVGEGVQFEDGTTMQADTVVWATGYRHDDRWIHITDALDERGQLRTTGLSTPVDGLYVIGRPWQRNRGSALIGYVGEDARLLADEVQRLVATDRRPVRTIEEPS